MHFANQDCLWPLEIILYLFNKFRLNSLVERCGVELDLDCSTLPLTETEALELAFQIGQLKDFIDFESDFIDFEFYRDLMMFLTSTLKKQVSVGI